MPERRLPPTRRALFAALLLLLLALAGAGAAYRAWQARHQQNALGRAIFQGEVAVPARLARHAVALPPLATRCANCHEDRAVLPLASPAPPSSAATILGAGAAVAARAAASAPATFAVRLDAAWLAEPHVRRGGPAVAYDAARLCRLLRSGIDPANIVISPTMPRYDSTDAQCQALWAYLQSR